MASAPPRATPVGFRRVAAKAEDVAITYVGHSTYYIDTPGGVRIATDFNGYYRTGRLPDVATMASPQKVVDTEIGEGSELLNALKRR